MIDYKSAGVDIAKGDAFVDKIKTMVGGTLNENVESAIGGYASLYKIDPDRYIASSTDGVGTKLKLAIELNQHDTIGIDLVAMCANDLVCTGARPLFFLDYLATGKLDLEVSTQIMHGMTQGCLETGMALIGGETAEMPGMYAPNHYDLAGFSVGEVYKNQMPQVDKIQKGHVVIGLKSSGFHSNGYSLIRKVSEKESVSFKEQLLTPTRLYVKTLLSVFNKYREDIHGIIHVTGGGLENYKRLNTKVGFDFTKMPKVTEIQPMFATIIENARLSAKDAYQTFNMGIGMSLIVENEKAESIMQTLSELGEQPQIVGEVTDSAQEIIYPRF
jgi:phosphoribosylformylglycinamidine cyclo-ligase